MKSKNTVATVHHDHKYGNTLYVCETPEAATQVIEMILVENLSEFNDTPQTAQNLIDEDFPRDGLKCIKLLRAGMIDEALTLYLERVTDDTIDINYVETIEPEVVSKRKLKLRASELERQMAT